MQVIRVHRGVLNVPAEFKTVSISNSVNCLETVNSIYKKFRVTDGLPEDYYLSVLVFESGFNL